MKHIKHLFTALLLLCSTIAFAEEVTIDGIRYDLLKKGRVAKVVKGEKEYYGSIVIPKTVEYNGVIYSVTSIGEDAFRACDGLKSIEIPNSVTSIGEEAFFACSGLKSIIIPNSVKSIGDQAFQFCEGLTGELVIPNSVTSIGHVAFAQCSSLKSVVIGDSVTRIRGYTFSRCSNLASVVIGNNVESIGEGAFSDCTGIKSIVIGNNIISIWKRAFYNCKSLTSIKIPNSVERIEYEAFAYCENLTDFYCLAANVPSTASNAFNESYPEYMTLHIPAEAVIRYKNRAPWNSFRTIVTLDAEINKTSKYEMPTVVYNNDTLSFNCKTEGTEFATDVTCIFCAPKMQ